MVDIAPLGFAVDTAALASAADVAQNTAAKITGVADAADQVAASTSAASTQLGATTVGVKSYGDAHVVAATAVRGTQASTAQLHKDMLLLSETMDPTTARAIKLGETVAALNRLHETGAINAARYRQELSQLYREMNNPVRPIPRSDDAQHNPFGEFLRSATYRVPFAGRELRRVIGEGESGFPVGSILAGVAGGMIVGEGMRLLMELPGKLAEANDQAERLDRQLDSVGAGGLSHAVDLADRLNVSVSGAAEALVKYTAALALVPAANGGVGENAFSAALAAGRLGGLDEKAREASADQLANLANKPVVNGTDISSLMSANPQLANSIAQQLGVGGANGLVSLASTGKLTGDALIQAAGAASDELKRQSDLLPRNAKEWETAAKNSSDRLDQIMGDGISRFFYKLSDKVNVGLAHLFGDSSPAPGVTTKLPPTAQQLSSQAIAAALKETEGVGTSASRAAIQKQISDITAALQGAGGDQADTLRGRQRSLQLQLDATPLGNIKTQVQDITDAFGHGGDSGLIGVWQQALQVQREQEKQANGVASSLGSIVEQLLAVKRGMQAIADQDELKKLSDNIATLDAQVGVKPGSYDAKVSAHDIEMRRFFSDRAEYDSTGASNGTPVASDGGMTISPTGRAGFNSFGNDARAYFGGRYGTNVGAGIAAGITAEGGGLGFAANGAFGIGQWRGSRQAELFRRFGTSPDRDQELMFLQSELEGGDPGGKSVLTAKSPQEALTAYIRNFMRPGPGVAGDLRRGFGALGVRGSVNIAGGAGGASAGVPDQRNRVASGRDEAFFDQLRNDALGQIGALIGYDSAPTFGQTGNVTGGVARSANEQAASYVQRQTDGARERLTLEQKIRDTVEGLAPAYRDAYAAAARVADAAQQHEKSAAATYKLLEDADDNAARAAAARTGNTGLAAYTELQLKLKSISESSASPDDQATQIAAAIRDEHSKQDVSVAKVTGSEQDRSRDLVQQLSLLRFQGDELDKQKRIMDANRQIEIDMVGRTRSEIDARKAEVAALIEGNAVLQKRLEFMTNIDDSFKDGLGLIGDAWSKMFGDMERTGKLHVNTLLRGIEDGFYQMVDDLEKKLVISPLLSMLEKLGTNLVGGLLGGGGTPLDIGSFSNNTAPMIDVGAFPGASAAGNVFGPGGMMAFTRGGIFNTPTRFAMGGGGQGIAGEGSGLYEAIVPLKRGADGKLGLSAPGGGNGGMQVIINDHRGASAAPVEVQEREQGNGSRSLEITLRDQQRSNVAGGRLDSDMRAAYGISRPAVKR